MSNSSLYVLRNLAIKLPYRVFVLAHRNNEVGMLRTYEYNYDLRVYVNLRVRLLIGITY